MPILATIGDAGDPKFINECIQILEKTVYIAYQQCHGRQVLRHVMANAIRYVVQTLPPNADIISFANFIMSLRKEMERIGKFDVRIPPLPYGAYVYRIHTHDLRALCDNPHHVGENFTIHMNIRLFKLLRTQSDMGSQSNPLKDSHPSSLTLQANNDENVAVATRKAAAPFMDYDTIKEIRRLIGIMSKQLEDMWKEVILSFMQLEENGKETQEQQRMARIKILSRKLRLQKTMSELRFQVDHSTLSNRNNKQLFDYILQAVGSQQVK